MPARGDVAAKYARKRKSGLDDDTTEGMLPRGERRRRRERDDAEKDGDSDREASPVEKRAKRKEKPRARGESPSDDQTNEESLSIEDTNALRAKLGLAPLNLDDAPKVRDSESGDPNEKLVVEDGFEFTHRVAADLGEKKRQEALREKLETAKEKRRIYAKVLKEKGLAEDDEDDSPSNWVEKQRRLDEEKRLALQRAKALEEMDAEFGVDRLFDDEAKKKRVAQQQQKRRDQAKGKSDLAGITVAHAKDVFLEGRDTVLVLQDKDVLDTGEEVLVNPNLIDEERYKKNIENRKRKDRYNPYGEEVDEFGVARKQDLLAKYNEELEGPKKETFQLDELGNVDVNEEARQLEVRRRLHAASRNLVSLETPKLKIASEFFTQEEMIAFKKPKKGKDGKKMRKRGALKAEDLVPDESNAGGKDLGSRSRVTVKSESQEPTKKTKAGSGWTELSGEEREEGELDEPGGGGTGETANVKSEKSEKSVGVGIDVARLARLAADSDSDSDDEKHDVDLSGVRIDDDAEEELAFVLDKTRRLKTAQRDDDRNSVDVAAQRVREMIAAYGGKMETIEDDDEEEENNEGARAARSDVVIDATSEYCRNLGEIPTYGLAGNRRDAIDISELGGNVGNDGGKMQIDGEEEESDEDDGDRRQGHSTASSDSRETRRRHSVEQMDDETGKGIWLEATATTSAVICERAREREREKRERERRREQRDAHDEDEESYNVLGEEADVTKGVGAMLKLAGQKGYLEASGDRRPAGPSLKHLESKRYSQVDAGRFDIEEKYTKKLERMGTTGTGPTRSFTEKRDYQPQVKLNYTDELGRDMDMKDAFRVLSWKFHGKGPGKKQIGKRMEKRAKKELMKKMNSSDTPLGTLEKQLRKQEALQTPFLVLSGGGAKDGAPLKKE